MGVFTNDGKDEMLDGSTIALAALFNGVPGGGGTELTGGSPAYARKAVTLTAASAGSMSITADTTFDVPTGATVNYVAYYETGGTTLLAYDDVTQEVYGAQGEYKILAASTSFTI